MASTVAKRRRALDRPLAARDRSRCRPGGVSAGRSKGDGYPRPVPTLRLFAAARQAAGTGTATVAGATVGAVLDEASVRFGPDFVAVLDTARVWCNGEPVERDHPVIDTDEVAVLPPVSGGAGDPGDGSTDGSSDAGVTA
jgi:molybdopterin converting factor small subunit